MNIAQLKAQAEAVQAWDKAGMLNWYGVFSYLPFARRFRDAGFTDPQEARRWANATREILCPDEMIQWTNAAG